MPQTCIRRSTDVRALIIALTVLSLTLATVARAEVCSDYRSAIDAYRVESDGVFALRETLKAARRGLGAARATRAALKVLNSELALEILEYAGSRTTSQLAVANTASATTIKAFEAIFEVVKPIIEDLTSARAGELDAARATADAAADLALDSLGAFKAAALRTTLKAASASVSASHVKTTTAALVSVYESIYRAACQ